MSHPWMKFYASDWRADPGLRACSIAARGMWMEMLCLMWDATPQGSLLVNGKQPSVKTLAALCGVTAKDAGSLVTELEGHGVFSRDGDGTAFSRRMRRDIDKAARDSANGRRGGNPNLPKKQRAGVNPQPNPQANPGSNLDDNGEDKAQKPEARLYPSQTVNLVRLVSGQGGRAVPDRTASPSAGDDDAPFGRDGEACP